MTLRSVCSAELHSMTSRCAACCAIVAAHSATLPPSDVPTSVTGGDNRLQDVPADRINLEWVLGNKLLVGSLLIGFGTFNLVEGVIDHHLLGIDTPALDERPGPEDGAQR